MFATRFFFLILFFDIAIFVKLSMWKQIYLPMNTVANICQEAGNVLTMDKIT